MFDIPCVFHFLFREAARKAVNMDTMETQVMADSQAMTPSPVSKMQPLDAAVDPTQEQACGQEETAEEEEQTSDEFVEPIDPHNKETLVIDSDEDTLPPPRKLNAKSPAAAKPGTSASSSSKPDADQRLEGQPEEASRPDDSQTHEVEDILDSEEEKVNDKKGTFQDWGLLVCLDDRWMLDS